MFSSPFPVEPAAPPPEVIAPTERRVDPSERLVRDLALRAPAEHRRLVVVESAAAKPHALDLHRASPFPTVLVSPSLREGVDLPDDELRFQIVTKMPYPDLGDPWTAARQARDPRWYALETAKALVQAYGRSCRHAGDRSWRRWAPARPCESAASLA